MGRDDCCGGQEEASKTVVPYFAAYIARICLYLTINESFLENRGVVIATHSTKIVEVTDIWIRVFFCCSFLCLFCLIHREVSCVVLLFLLFFLSYLISP